MGIYYVSYEVRQSGAIGVFEWHMFTVQAENEKDAHEKAFNEAHARGFETRNGPIIKKG